MKGIKQYQTASVESVVNVSNPAEITAMLYDSALKNMYLASHSAKQGDIANKSAAISKAEAIIVTLASTLKDEHAPEISENLRRLYDFVLNEMNDFVVDGAKDLSASIDVVKQLKSAWDEIKDLDVSDKSD